jgi:hypothetical protein
MSNVWLSRKEALDIVRHHLKSSPGRAERIFKDACTSGEVRAVDASPVRLLNDDGIVGMDLRPGGKDYALAFREPNSKHSSEDLLDWLNRYHPIVSPSCVTPKSNKLARVQQAIHIKWPNGVPSAAELPNKILVSSVLSWIKKDCEERGIPFAPISEKHIRRAAGRK